VLIWWVVSQRRMANVTIVLPKTTKNQKTKITKRCLSYRWLISGFFVLFRFAIARRSRRPPCPRDVLAHSAHGRGVITVVVAHWDPWWRLYSFAKSGSRDQGRGLAEWMSGVGASHGL